MCVSYKPISQAVVILERRLETTDADQHFSVLILERTDFKLLQICLFKGSEWRMMSESYLPLSVSIFLATWLALQLLPVTQHRHRGLLLGHFQPPAAPHLEYSASVFLSSLVQPSSALRQHSGPTDEVFCFLKVQSVCFFFYFVQFVSFAQSRGWGSAMGMVWRTSSSSCRARCRWISIQHGVSLMLWRG